MTYFTITAALLCIVALVFCWAHARQFGLARQGWWPFLGLAAVALIGWELLPGPATARASPAERVGRSALEIAEENLRLADEIGEQLRELQWRVKRN